MHIQIIPTEILLLIFQYLPRTILFQCATVCQRWYPPALQLFYESVELSEKNKPIWLNTIRQEQQQHTIKDIGVFVKKLTISLAFSTTLTQSDFLQVLSFLPFVKCIDINHSGYKLHYLAYLSKRSPNCVTYLEEINAGEIFTDYQMQQYFLCAYSFRQSLRNLTLRNLNAVYDMDGQATPVLTVLGKFEKLERVSVMSDVAADNNELARLIASFQACTQLTHFTYKNTCLETQTIPDYIQFNRLLQKDRFQRSRNKLQTIEIELPYLTRHYVYNILCSFPLQGLNTLAIKITHSDYRTWINNSNETFSMYLGCVRNLRISIFNYNQRNYRRSFAEKGARGSRELSKYWNFIHILRGEKPIFCQLKLTNYKLGSTPDLSITRDEYKLILTYNTDCILDLPSCLEEFSPLYSPLRSSFENTSWSRLNSVVIETNQTDFHNMKTWLDDLVGVCIDNYTVIHV